LPFDHFGLPSSKPPHTSRYKEVLTLSSAAVSEKEMRP
jgi:hypothetical protein